MTYKIYTVQITQLGPAGVVVVSTLPHSGSNWEAEGLLLLPGAEKVSGWMLKFFADSFRDAPIVLDEDFVLNEMLNEVKLAIDLHLNSQYKGLPYPPPVGEIRPAEAVVLYSGRRIKLPLKDALERTRSDEVRTLLQTLERVKSPTLGELPQSDF